MKKSIVAAIAIAIAVLVGAASAQAGGKLVPEGSLLTFSAAYTTTKSSITDETIDGGAFSLSYEGFIDDNPTTLALWLGYSSSDGTTTGPSGVSTTVDYQGLPVLIGGRFFFTQSKVAFYVGFGAGVQFGSARISIDGSPPVEDSESNFAMGLPIGILWFVGEKTYINVNYTPYYLANSAYLENFSSNFAVGVGFAFR